MKLFFFWMSTKILSVNLYTYISSEISIWCRLLDYLIRVRNYFWTSKSETPWGHRPDRRCASFWGLCSRACQDIHSKGKNKFLPLSSPLHRKSQNTPWVSLDIRYQFPCVTWTHSPGDPKSWISWNEQLRWRYSCSPEWSTWLLQAGAFWGKLTAIAMRLTPG